MNINFTKAYLLLLIPVLLFFIWFAAAKSPKTFRKNFLCAIRSLTVVLIVLAMAGMGVIAFTDMATTVFVVDLSASTVGDQEAAAQFVAESTKHKTDKDLVGVVAFGANTAVEVAPAKEIQFSSFQSFVEQDGTNIENALKMAQALLSEESQKRLVLLSDGKETTGNVLQFANALKAADVVVDGFLLEQQLTQEVQITRLNTPSVIEKNVAYEVELQIHSLTETTANIKLYKGSELVVNQQTLLRAGENRLIFSDVAQQGGGVIYRGEITAQTDTMLENNKAYAYTYIDDVPGVLIVQDDREKGSEFAKVLEAAGIRVSAIKTTQVPLNMEQLNLWDCVVLADVSAEDINEDFLNLLDTFVKTTGGGLITLGGENSYALGSYQTTVLNDILPVSMELETDGEKPDLAMVMVIDRSGSMTDASYGISRMEMAKEAAMRGAEAMEAEDSIGVLAFDTEPAWYVEMQKIGGNETAITNAIGQIQPGGGTSILPALEEAFRVIKDTDAKLKHIILLTDGQAERDGYGNVINAMKEYGITLSTIAVGSGADTQLLTMLANQGGGRYYYTDEFTNLPQIFTKETTLAGKEYLNNRTFYPEGKDDSAIIKGVDSVPYLTGYVSATAKPRADVVLTSDEQEPILAAWQYGIGRSVSWMSDASGQWTQSWLSSDEGLTLWRNMVSWVIRGGVASQVIFNGEINGDQAKITAKMPFDSNVSAVSATIVSADNVEVRTPMVSTAPGIYEADVQGMKEGGYIVSLSMEMKDGSAEVVRGGFVMGYSKEYDISAAIDGRELMNRLVTLTGGRMIEEVQEVFTAPQKTATRTKDLAPLLLSCALLLFLFEVAARRMNIIISRIEGMWRSLKTGVGTVLHNKEKKNKNSFSKQDRSKEDAKIQEKPSGMVRNSGIDADNGQQHSQNNLKTVDPGDKKSVLESGSQTELKKPSTTQALLKNKKRR